MRCASSVLGMVLAARAVAAEPCEDAVKISLFESRLALEPQPAAGLGVELAMRSITVGWGRCAGLRHQAQLVAVEAPDWGDTESRVVHLGRYQLAWHAGDWSLHAGLRAASIWGGDARLATPVLGLRSWLARDLLVELAVESAGLFAWSREGAVRAPRRDVAVEVTTTWPATAAVRGELRLRARDYQLDEMRRVDDVTATAGLGFALATREGMRGIPGFLGLAVRRDEATTALLVTELAFAAGPP